MKPMPRGGRRFFGKRGRATYRPLVELLESRTVMSASIFGSVWNDIVADGVRAASEVGLAGAIAYLDDGSGAYDGSQTHAVTNGSGEYLFQGLPGGVYTVALVLPAGALLTFPGGSQSLTLGANDERRGVDFGLRAMPAELPNQPLTSDPGVQQMPSVAVNPLDAKHLVMAYMDYGLVATGFAGIGVRVSHDGGATWQDSSVPLPANFDQAAGQPIVQF